MGSEEVLSCLTQLLEFFGDIEDALDEGKSVDTVYLDCKRFRHSSPQAFYSEGGGCRNWRTHNIKLD